MSSHESRRSRNFSPWAYWSLHLRTVVDDDPVPQDPEALAAWRVRVALRVRSLLGTDPPTVPLDLEVTDETDCGTYLRSRVVYDAEAAMSVPAYLLVPKQRRTPGPAVLAIHGHGAGKSMVCGIDDGDPARAAEIAGYHGDYAHQLAARGFVVLAPDLRCFGERQDPQWSPDDHKYDCDWNLVCAVMAGRSPLAQNLWDLQRSLDVLCEHPLVDPARIGACGLSYGATMTLFLAAVDERVRAAVVSGYLSSWRGAHRVPWNMCGSQVLPGQLGRIEHVDLGALVAPRPLLVESGTQDILFPIDDARAAVATLGPLYAALGAPGAIEHDVFDDGHRWHGERAYAFLAEHLADAPTLPLP